MCLDWMELHHSFNVTVLFFLLCFQVISALISLKFIVSPQYLTDVVNALETGTKLPDPAELDFVSFLFLNYLLFMLMGHDFGILIKIISPYGTSLSLSDCLMMIQQLMVISTKIP